MNREGAETYLRLLAEAELRGPMGPARRQPWAGPGGSTARLTAVAQALTAVRAIDPEIVEDILADFDLAVSVRQPADRPRSGPPGAAVPRPARLRFPPPGTLLRRSRLAALASREPVRAPVPATTAPPACSSWRASPGAGTAAARAGLPRRQPDLTWAGPRAA